MVMINDHPCIPKTITPNSVWEGLVVLLSVSLVFWTILMGIFIDPSWALLWSLFITLLGSGVAISSGTITEDIVDFHGVLLFNPWAKKRRVLFQGFSFKLPWEKIEHNDEGNVVLTSLVRAISTTETKNCTTIDPAVAMDATLTIHLRIKIKGVSPEQAAENFIRFRDIKEDSLTGIIRSEVEKMFAEYYAENKKDNLLKPHVVQQAVCGDPDNQEIIREMERKYGVEIGIVLSSSKADKATQDMMRAPAMTDALVESISKLKAIGVEPEPARRTAMTLDPNNNYTEESFNLNVNVDAPDLKNMTHVNFVGAPIPTKRKGGQS